MKIKQVLILLLVLFLAASLPVRGATDKELYDMGKTAYNNKQYSEAYDYFKQAVAINPGKASYHYNLGLAARKLKSYSEAYVAFSKARELDPQIKFTKKKQDFLDKLEEMRRHVPVESGPGRNDDEGAYAKGKAAYKNKDYQTAFNYFKQAVEANPQKAGNFYNLGLAARKLKNYPAAFMAFSMAQQLDPQISFTKNKQDFYNKLEEMRKKTPQKTQRTSSTADTKFEYHKEVFERGKVLYKEGRYRDAYEKFKEAAAINRKDAKYQYNLGLAAHKLGLYLDAYNAYLNAEILDPDLNFTTKKSEFRQKMEEVIKYRREHGDEAQKKKDLWTPGTRRPQSEKKGSFFTGRNILYMAGGLIIVIILYNILRSRRSSSADDTVAGIDNMTGSTGDTYHSPGPYVDRNRFHDKWWKRNKYKTRNKQKLWRLRRKGDRSYIDHEYRDRDIYDDDRDSYNQFAAGAIAHDVLSSDSGSGSENSYSDAS